jgi:hypothetical protein
MDAPVPPDLPETAVKADPSALEGIEGSDTEIPVPPELAAGHVAVVDPFQQGIDRRRLVDLMRGTMRGMQAVMPQDVQRLNESLLKVHHGPFLPQGMGPKDRAPDFTGNINICQSCAQASTGSIRVNSCAMFKSWQSGKPRIATREQGEDINAGLRRDRGQYPESGYKQATPAAGFMQ